MRAACVQSEDLAKFNVSLGGNGTVAVAVPSDECRLALRRNLTEQFFTSQLPRASLRCSGVGPLLMEAPTHPETCIFFSLTRPNLQLLKYHMQ